MPRQIALFIDGTFNSALPLPDGDTTNVHKLFMATSGEKQYITGVGGVRRSKFHGATGLGTSERIRQAYRYLCSNYQRGDSIYLFGFSRGAFAVRSLAGFAFRVGLLLEGNKTEANLKKAWKLYTKPAPGAFRELRKLLVEITGEYDRPVPERTDLPIHFIGVWDTVAALGAPIRGRPAEERFARFHRHELPRNVNHARHALALHECRQIFEPLLFTGMTAPHQTMEQRWFPGAHADAGGGYPRAESGYAKIALAWMAQEAQAKNFQCDMGALLGSFGAASETIHQQVRIKGWEVRPALKRPSRLRLETRRSFQVDAGALSRLLEPGATTHAFPTRALLAEVDALTVRLAGRAQPHGPAVASVLASFGVRVHRVRSSDIEAAARQSQVFAGQPFNAGLGDEEQRRLALWIALALWAQNGTRLESLLTNLRHFATVAAHADRPASFTDLDCAKTWQRRVRFLSGILERFRASAPPESQLDSLLNELASIEDESSTQVATQEITVQQTIFLSRTIRTLKKP